MITSMRGSATAVALAVLLALAAVGTAEAAKEFKIVKSPRVIWWADLAYDSVNAKFLVVWVTEEAIFGQFIDPAGKLSGQAFIVSAGPGHYYPRLAFGGGRFVVVYSHALGNGQGIDYQARFVTYDHPPSVGKVMVLDHPARFTQPGAVAYVKSGDYFTVVYPQKKGLVLRKLFQDGGTTQAQVVTDLDSPCSMNIPDIAVNTAKAAGENAALVTGWRDPTSPGCQSGIWYQYLDDNGFPAAGTPDFVVERGGIAREQQAAFNPNSRQYLLQWSQRPKGVVQGIIRGREFDVQRPVGDTYDLQKPVTKDAAYGNNGFGEGTLMFEPTTRKFLLAMRGADKGGPAPVWKKQIAGGGKPVAGSLGKLTKGTATAPWPIIATNQNGVVLTIYRGYYRINGVVTAAAKWLAPPPAKPAR